MAPIPKEDRVIVGQHGEETTQGRWNIAGPNITPDTHVPSNLTSFGKIGKMTAAQTPSSLFNVYTKKTAKAHNATPSLSHAQSSTNIFSALNPEVLPDLPPTPPSSRSPSRKPSLTPPNRWCQRQLTLRYEWHYNSVLAMPLQHPHHLPLLLQPMVMHHAVLPTLKFEPWDVSSQGPQSLALLCFLQHRCRLSLHRQWSCGRTQWDSDDEVFEDEDEDVEVEAVLVHMIMTMTMSVLMIGRMKREKDAGMLCPVVEACLHPLWQALLQHHPTNPSLLPTALSVLA
jgi:hypothetical protein